MNAHAANATGGMIEHALRYARQGLRVLPCDPSTKQPLVPRDKDANGKPIPKTGGLTKATTDENTIRGWWKRWPSAMIGIRMGDGVFALDPDMPKKPGDPDGMEAWQHLTEAYGYHPCTHTHTTPRGGRHILFRAPAGIKITNRPGALPAGIDVRGEDGYVMAPPSRMADGRTYRLEEPEHEFCFAEPPDWLLDLLRKPEPKSTSERAKAIAEARGGRIHKTFVSSEETGSFFRSVNSRALANLAAWVPVLIPSAKEAGGIWRITSRDLGRDRQEDLSASPSGIKDWGVWDVGDAREGKRTPIDLVIEYHAASTVADAALWLCSKIGIEPEAMGWRGRQRANGKTSNGSASADEDPAAEFAAKPPPGGEGEKRERNTIAHQGVLVPVERDRLDIAQALSEAPAFPIEHLPPLMRGAVEALQEHVQAPPSLCAHAVIGAAMLSTQGLADVEIGPLGQAKPLSLFMLAVAVSGERKSACDNLALAAVAKHEAMLRAEYEDQIQTYRAAKAAFDAERRHIERDGKATAADRRERLMALAEPPAPLLPVLRAKEPNLEGLLNLLANGQPAVGVFTSEGGQFLGGHGMTQEAKTRTVTGLSELWDSGSAQRVRAKETTFLQGRRVGISLAAQPKVAAALLSDELAQDQGFVGRFLVTMPDSTIGTRQVRETYPLEDPRLGAFHRRCRQILNQPLPLREGSRNEVQPPALTLSREAWAVWQGLAQSFEDGCKPEGMYLPVRAAALKMAENVARIAAILTVFEEPEAASARGGTISGEVMAAAASIGLFYLKEALRLTGHSVLDPETRALSELAAWLVEKIGAEQFVTPSLIQRRAPAHLRTDAATTQRRVRKLVEFGALEYVGRAEMDCKPVREAYRITGEEGGK